LDHPNIVKLYDVINDNDNEKCYMIFEYVSEGELYDYIVKLGRLSEEDARKFIRQIVSALEYCHSFLIIHRDLKPENLLLDDQLNVKISDFGLSNVIKPGRRFSTFCGSLHYASPEILLGRKYLGPGIDVWSLGIIMFCLIVGHQPWDGSSASELLRCMKEDGLQIPEDISDDCVDLLLNMLKLKEEDRIQISQIRDHPWILQDFDEPPQSYLPEPCEIDDVDLDILDQLKQIGFTDSSSDESINEILSMKRSQIVATYHLLLNKKNKSQKQRVRKKTQRSFTMSENNGTDIFINKNLTSEDEEVGDETVGEDGVRRRNTIATNDIPEFVKEITKKKKSKTKVTSKSPSKKKTIRTSKSPNKTKIKSKSPRPPGKDKDGNLLIQSIEEIIEEDEIPQELLDILGDKFGQNIRTCRITNARPIINLEQLEQEKFFSLKSKNRSPSPLKRKSVINYFDEIDDSVRLKSLFPNNFRSSTTSSKPIRYIQKELRRVLNKLSIKNQLMEEFSYSCNCDFNEEEISFMVEIVNILDFEHLKGITIRHEFGNEEEFEKIHNLILQNLLI